MGFVKSLFGSKSGVPNIQGADKTQLKTSYEQQQDAIKRQQEFVKSLESQNYLAGQADVFQKQQALEQQLGAMARGEGGPSPAQAMLAQATGQNVANQAALMAGQRGAGSNVGLIARQAAQQGTAAQQQSLGQAATLRAQEQMAALQAQQQQQQMLGNLSTAQVGQEQAGLGQLGNITTAQRGQLLGQQQQANALQAQYAGQQAQAQSNLFGNLLGAAGTVAGTYFGGPIGGAIGGGLASSLGSSGGGGITPSTGGQVMSTGQTQQYNLPGLAEGGKVESGPRSSYGKLMMAKGGKVPALVSPGEVYLKPKDVAQVAAGKKAPMDGEKIPGKAKVGGAKNDYANDTVKKVLDEGGIVLPRSVTQSKDADKKAAEFVRAILKNKLR